MKRLLALCLTAGLVLGLSSPAIAGNPTPPPPPLPADQVNLAGGCITLLDVSVAITTAIYDYVPNGPPAGIIVNGNWVPAALAATTPGNFVDYDGCPVPQPPVTTPVTVAPTTTPTTAPVTTTSATLAPTTTSTVPVTSTTTVPVTTTTTARRCHRR